MRPCIVSVVLIVSVTLQPLAMGDPDDVVSGSGTGSSSQLSFLDTMAEAMQNFNRFHNDMMNASTGAGAIAQPQQDLHIQHSEGTQDDGQAYQDLYSSEPLVEPSDASEVHSPQEPESECIRSDTDDEDDDDLADGVDEPDVEWSSGFQSDVETWSGTNTLDSLDTLSSLSTITSARSGSDSNHSDDCGDHNDCEYCDDSDESNACSDYGQQTGHADRSVCGETTESPAKRRRSQ